MYEDKKLPVWVVVKRSYGYAWRQRTLLAVPLGLLMALEILSGMISLGVVVTVRPQAPFQIFIDVGRSALSLAVTLSFAVGLHRTVLLDEIRAGAAFFRWDRFLWNAAKAALFALASVILLLALLAGTLALSLGIDNFTALYQLHPRTALALLFLPALAALYAGLRFSLAFPAAALGYREVFYLSWRLTQGNALRLFATIVLVDLPVTLPGLLLAWAIMMGIVPLTVPEMLLFWLPLGAVLNALSLLLPAIAMSLNFFLLFKVSDEFGVS